MATKKATRAKLARKPGDETASPENLRKYLEAEYLRCFGEAWNDDFAESYQSYGFAREAHKPRGAGAEWHAMREQEALDASEFPRDRKRLNAALDSFRRKAVALKRLQEELGDRWMPRSDEYADYDNALALGLDKLSELMDALPEWFLAEPPPWRSQRSTKRRSLVQGLPSLWEKPRSIALISLLCGIRPDGYGPKWTVTKTVDVEADNIRKAVDRYLLPASRAFETAPDDPDTA